MMNELAFSAPVHLRVRLLQYASEIGALGLLLKTL